MVTHGFKPREDHRCPVNSLTTTTPAEKCVSTGEDPMSSAPNFQTKPLSPDCSGARQRLTPGQDFDFRSLDFKSQQLHQGTPLPHAGSDGTPCTWARPPRQRGSRFHSHLLTKQCCSVKLLFLPASVAAEMLASPRNHFCLRNLATDSTHSPGVTQMRAHCVMQLKG